MDVVWVHRFCFWIYMLLWILATTCRRHYFWCGNCLIVGLHIGIKVTKACMVILITELLPTIFAGIFGVAMVSYNFRYIDCNPFITKPNCIEGMSIVFSSCARDAMVTAHNCKDIGEIPTLSDIVAISEETVVIPFASL